VYIPYGIVRHECPCLETLGVGVAKLEGGRRLISVCEKRVFCDIMRVKPGEKHGPFDLFLHRANNGKKRGVKEECELRVYTKRLPSPASLCSSSNAPGRASSWISAV
jgi:hypothetical protein